MVSYYDSNFGHWDMEDGQDDVDFYHEVQRKSVWKTCGGCRTRVKILPQYAYCDSCATKIENGWDF